MEQRLAEFGEMVDLDLLRLGTTADADEIKDTAVTQPLIVALGVVVAGQLGLRGNAGGSVVVAGHSVGELTAAAVAGALAPDDAVALAARRGAEMAAACALTPTGMSAVLGGATPTWSPPDRSRRPDPGQPQRRRPDRRRRSQGRTRRFAENPPAGAGCDRSPSPARSTPTTWPRQKTPCARTPRR